MRRALGFLTPLPVGADSLPDDRTFGWFPAVGVLVGLVVGGAWWGAERLWPPAVAAAVVVGVDLAVTGMLHVDGLIDSADGLLPHLPSVERRLEVMEQPDVGAFGVVVAGAVLLMRFVALASMAPSVLLIAGLWCGSRTVMAAAARALPYARSQGLATAFGRRDWKPVCLYGLIVAVSLGAFADGRRTEIAVACGFAAAWLVVLAARRRIGGFTGDVLGAAGVVGETVGLLIAAAKW